MDRTVNREGVRKIWDRYKFAVLVMLAGAALLLPGGHRPAEPPAAQAPELTAVQREMEDILTRIQGVGRLRLMLSVETDGERQLAQDTELSCSGSADGLRDYSRRAETVKEHSGSAVVVQTRSPVYRGALVVCEGGSRAGVRLAVTEAVAALTGLSSDRISVAEWQ